MQVRGKVYINNTRLFKDIDWSQPESVVREYEQRIQDLYISPAETLQVQLEQFPESQAGFSFGVGLICLCTIDALARCEYENLRGNGHVRERFEEWLKKHSDLREPEIDCLYKNFRNKLVHEARIKGGCFVCEKKQTTTVVNLDTGYSMVDSAQLLELVRQGFRNYFQEVRSDDMMLKSLYKHLYSDFEAERIIFGGLHDGHCSNDI